MPEWHLTRLNGRYCITWNEPDGRRRRYRLPATAKTRAEANAIAAARFADFTAPPSSRVADIWEAYRKDKAGRAVLKTMDYTWTALSGPFGEMDGDDITIQNCRDHIAKRRAAGLSDGTIHTELGHLRTVLRWAEAHKMINRAPAIERPMKPDPKTDYLTRHQVSRLIECAHADHIKLAIRLLVGTGARVTAALQLTWDRVDFNRKLIHLRNPFDRERRKGRATVPINDTLLDALKEAYKTADTNFVVEYGGKPILSIKRGIKRAAKDAGILDVSPHVFRHSAAVWMAEAGHAMTEISQYLGHSDSRITERVYSRFSPEHLRKLANSLDI